MELESLNCPNCGGCLEIDDGLDTFFCKYCGHKIVIKGQSDVAYEAKVRVKDMEHKERLQDKKYAQERYEKEEEKKEYKRTLCIVFGIFGSILVLILIGIFFGEAGEKRQEQKLQATVDEIMIDIKNEEFDEAFDEAYIKAESLYWDDSYTSDGVKKWDSIRDEVIKQIEEAEKEAKKRNNKPE